MFFSAVVAFIAVCTAVWSQAPITAGSYQNGTASAKLATVWSSVMSNTSPQPWGGVFSIITLLAENMNVSFDWKNDTMKGSRGKPIHTYNVHSLIV